MKFLASLRVLYSNFNFLKSIYPITNLNVRVKNQFNILFNGTSTNTFFNNNTKPSNLNKSNQYYSNGICLNSTLDFFFLIKRFCVNLWAFSYNIYLRGTGVGFWYIQGLIFVFFVDACLTDDEPLWEPIEWSLVQTWILFIFIFAWIGENLIVSRYGSYTGRDKRVWMAWYKTFWLIEIFYILNFGVTACFVTTPFYFEVNYALPFIVTWWHWYSRAFFFKFISIFTLVLTLSYIIQLSTRWLNWKKIMFMVILVNIFLAYLLYTNFVLAFFGYLTNSLWYRNVRLVDYIQLSHEPVRWGWGPKTRDHYTYHPVRTIFWFKNDGPFASTFMLFQMYLFLTLFFVYLYWIVLFRRIYSMKEVPITYTTYCVSALKQLFYCFVGLYFFIFLSFVTQYWRLPVEFLWGLNNQSWLYNTLLIIYDYPLFLLSIFSK